MSHFPLAPSDSTQGLHHHYKGTVQLCLEPDESSRAQRRAREERSGRMVRRNAAQRSTARCRNRRCMNSAPQPHYKTVPSGAVSSALIHQSATPITIKVRPPEFTKFPRIDQQLPASIPPTSTQVGRCVFENSIHVHVICIVT